MAATSCICHVERLGAAPRRSLLHHQHHALTPSRCASSRTAKKVKPPPPRKPWMPAANTSKLPAAEQHNVMQHGVLNRPKAVLRGFNFTPDFDPLSMSTSLLMDHTTHAMRAYNEHLYRIQTREQDRNTSMDDAPSGSEIFHYHPKYDEPIQENQSPHKREQDTQSMSRYTQNTSKVDTVGSKKNHHESSTVSIRSRGENNESMLSPTKVAHSQDNSYSKTSYHTPRERNRSEVMESSVPAKGRDNNPISSPMEMSHSQDNPHSERSYDTPRERTRSESMESSTPAKGRDKDSVPRKSTPNSISKFYFKKTYDSSMSRNRPESIDASNQAKAEDTDPMSSQKKNVLNCTDTSYAQKAYDTTSHRNLSDSMDSPNRARGQAMDTILGTKKDMLDSTDLPYSKNSFNAPSHRNQSEPSNQARGHDKEFMSVLRRNINNSTDISYSKDTYDASVHRNQTLTTKSNTREDRQGNDSTGTMHPLWPLSRATPPKKALSDESGTPFFQTTSRTDVQSNRIDEEKAAESIPPSRFPGSEDPLHHSIAAMHAREAKRIPGRWPITEDWIRARQELKWLRQSIHRRQPIITRTAETGVQVREALEECTRQYVDEQKPLAYIIGDIPFGSVEILCEAPVLIPRPETEEWAVRIRPYLRPTSILDICTGSGCLAVELTNHFQSSSTVAVDVSNAATKLATKNAEKAGVADRIHVLQHDLFSDDFLDRVLDARRNFKQSVPLQGFDLIVCNPPYITKEDYVTLPYSVKNWEDRLALVGELPAPSTTTALKTSTSSTCSSSSIPIESKLTQDAQLLLHRLGLGSVSHNPFRFSSSSSSSPSSNSNTTNESKLSQHDDGLVFYRRLFDVMDRGELLSHWSSTSKGKRKRIRLVLEVGKGQAQSVASMLKQCQHSSIGQIDIWKDFNGIERTVIGWDR